MLLADLVATARAVAAEPKRNTKIEHLAALLARAHPDELPAIVGMLAGEPRQGRIGVGWARLWSVRPQHATTPTLTVARLDEALTAIQETTGAGSSATRAHLLTELLTRATADEADFIRRLIGGELRQGALAGVMVDAIARAANVDKEAVRRALMLSGDLGGTAKAAVTGGESALAKTRLTVLRPVQPMLAATAESVEEALRATGPASVEWKLDGIRIQVHRDRDDVAIFTRNLNDITARLEGARDLVRAMPAERFVLDGEAIVLDENERPHLFQETMSSVGRRTRGPMLGVSLWFFDCLHLDGEDLIDFPLQERTDRLEGLVPENRIPNVRTGDPDEAQQVLARALDAGHEGVMVKALGSTYQAGRRGQTWRKVKPVRTLDLVVLGAEWGHGRRSGWLSNLHLGARDPESGSFVMVGKTFKGLTDDLLRWQTERLQALKTEERGITVYTRPELVVEIALDGVQRSPRYGGGVALRFARVVRYRPDKSPAEADTIEAVRALLPGP